MISPPHRSVAQLWTCPRRKAMPPTLARVAELADAPDLGDAANAHDQQDTAAIRNHDPATTQNDSDVSARTVEGSDDSGRFVGVVESALARVLTLAAEAGKWDVVRAVTAELERRTVAREGVAGADVVPLPSKATA